jgi:N-acetylglucosaminyldiphosphoundecaprenol N-acetyl-beta-D-mannosaminyltransferase
MACTRINLLSVPVDICQPEELEQVIIGLTNQPGTKQIVFLSVWDLLTARRNADLRNCLLKADLVLPISKSLLRGAAFLKLPIPVRYNPFTAVISILTILDAHYKSLYLLGSRKKSLLLAEQNVRSTYPNLHIVGRYVGYYPKAVERDIISAIYKSAPSLVLVSDGVPEKTVWAYRRRNQFLSSIFIYYRDALGIFSKRIKRVKDSVFNAGLEVWTEILHNPLKIFLVFPYFMYILLLLWYRLTRKGQSKNQ